MFPVTPGTRPRSPMIEIREPDLLPIADSSESSSLQFLRLQYNIVKHKSKELNKSADFTLTHSDSSRKAAAKLYSAV